MISKTPFSDVAHINKKTLPQSTLGKVSLVGSGPGDPDLLTVKAVKIIQQADIILYDRLVSDAIRGLFPRKTTAIYVGKAKDKHSVRQDEINQLLIEKTRSGLNVCRLKGGDAFIFGRGSEEMLELKKAGIEVEVVPGITAASGCTSYAGIPLTHRGLSQGCTFITAHAEQELNLNWQALAKIDHTLVFYMGLSRAEFIQRELCLAGLNPDTAMAFIENGCSQEQRVFISTVAEMANLVKTKNIQSPALIVIGKTVTLAEQLQWFCSYPQKAIQQLSA